jgi:hypothetical protein
MDPKYLSDNAPNDTVYAPVSSMEHWEEHLYKFRGGKGEKTKENLSALFVLTGGSVRSIECLCSLQV